VIPLVNWGEKSWRIPLRWWSFDGVSLHVTLLIGSLFSWTPSPICLSSAEIIGLLCTSRCSRCRWPCRISSARGRTVLKAVVSYGGVLLATASKISEQKHSACSTLKTGLEMYVQAIAKGIYRGSSVPSQASNFACMCHSHSRISGVGRILLVFHRTWVKLKFITYTSNMGINLIFVFPCIII